MGTRLRGRCRHSAESANGGRSLVEGHEKLYCEAAGLLRVFPRRNINALRKNHPGDWRDAVFEYVQVQTKL